MPNCQVREGFLDSEAIDALSPDAECFYHRLLLVVDDAGRFDGRPAMLATRCWPLRRDKRAADVEKWIQECAGSGLLITYEYAGKPYVQVVKVAKRGNSKASKFPWKDGTYKMDFVVLPSRDGEDGERSFVATSLPHLDPIQTPSEPHPDPTSSPLYGNGYGNGNENGGGNAAPPAGGFTQDDVVKIANAYPLPKSLRGAYDAIRKALVELLPTHKTHAATVEYLYQRVVAFANSHEGKATTQKAHWWFTEGRWNDPDTAWQPRTPNKPTEKDEPRAYVDTPLTPAQEEDRRRFHEAARKRQNGVSHAES